MSAHMSVSISIQATSQWSEERISAIVAEQKSLLIQLCSIWNLQPDADEEAREVFETLALMAKNVTDYGVLCWHRPKPLVNYRVAQPFLQAKTHAIRLYGQTGRAAWEYACKEIATTIIFEDAMRQMDDQYC